MKDTSEVTFITKDIGQAIYDAFLAGVAHTERGSENKSKAAQKFTDAAMERLFYLARLRANREQQ